MENNGEPQQPEHVGHPPHWPFDRDYARQYDQQATTRRPRLIPNRTEIRTGNTTLGYSTATIIEYFPAAQDAPAVYQVQYANGSTGTLAADTLHKLNGRD